MAGPARPVRPAPKKPATDLTADEDVAMREAADDTKASSGNPESPDTTDTPSAGNTAPPAEGVISPDPTVGQASETVRTDAPSATATTTDLTATASAGEKPKRKYTKRVLKDVPLDELGMSDDVPEDEWESHPLTASAGVRNESQQTLDKEFKELLDKWVEAGRPDARHSPRKRRVTSPEHAPAIRKMYAEAAKLYGVGIKFSPPAHDQHGREVIVYSPEKKIERPRKPKTDAAPKADATSTPTSGDGNLPGETKPAA